jgi:hypothetical protein
LLHVELDERAGKLLTFPGRGRFAGAETHDGIVPAHRLARPQPDVADDPVALIENSQDGDALRHRSDALFLSRTDVRALGPRAIRLLGALLLTAAAGERDERCCSGCRDEPLHAQSGVQGW